MWSQKQRSSKRTGGRFACPIHRRCSAQYQRHQAMSDAAHIIWAVNPGCIDFNPWPGRATDVDHPDELRVDLDPTLGVPI